MHNLRSVTVSIASRIKMFGIKSEIFFHNRSTSLRKSFSKCTYYPRLLSVLLTKMSFLIGINFRVLKPLDPFGSEKKQKVHRFTNNLQGLQKVVVKDFS